MAPVGRWSWGHFRVLAWTNRVASAGKPIDGGPSRRSMAIRDPESVVCASPERPACPPWRPAHRTPVRTAPPRRRPCCPRSGAGCRQWLCARRGLPTVRLGRRVGRPPRSARRALRPCSKAVCRRGALLGCRLHGCRLHGPRPTDHVRTGYLAALASAATPAASKLLISSISSLVKEPATSKSPGSRCSACMSLATPCHWEARFSPHLTPAGTW